MIETEGGKEKKMEINRVEERIWTSCSGMKDMKSHTPNRKSFKGHPGNHPVKTLNAKSQRRKTSEPDTKQTKSRSKKSFQQDPTSIEKTKAGKDCNGQANLGTGSVLDVLLGRGTVAQDSPQEVRVPSQVWTGRKNSLNHSQPSPQSQNYHQHQEKKRTPKRTPMSCPPKAAFPIPIPHPASPTNYAGAKFSDSPSAKYLPPPPVAWVKAVCPPITA